MRSTPCSRTLREACGWVRPQAWHTSAAGRFSRWRGRRHSGGPILGLVEDRTGWLWIATADSLLRVHRQRLASGRLGPGDLREFGAADGLIGLDGVKRLSQRRARRAGPGVVRDQPRVGERRSRSRGGAGRDAAGAHRRSRRRRRADRYARRHRRAAGDAACRDRVRGFESLGARARRLPLSAGRIRSRLDRPGRRPAGRLHQPRAGSVRVSRDCVERGRRVEYHRGPGELRRAAAALADRLVSRRGPDAVRAGRMGPLPAPRAAGRETAQSHGSTSAWPSARASPRSSTTRCCRAS